MVKQMGYDPDTNCPNCGAALLYQVDSWHRDIGPQVSESPCRQCGMVIRMDLRAPIGSTVFAIADNQDVPKESMDGPFHKSE